MNEKLKKVGLVISGVVAFAIIFDLATGAPAAEPRQIIAGAETGTIPTETSTPKSTETLMHQPSPSSTPEPSKTLEPKAPTKTRVVILPWPSPDPTATNTPYKNDELFNDQVAQITLRPGELRILKYLQTADHSKFCLKGANLGEIQVGIYEPGMTPEFAKNRFVNSKANGNFDKVVNKDQGCDQFAATGAGSFIKQYWPVAFHNSLNTVKSFFFTIGERSLGCLGAGEKLRVIEDLGSGLITWVGKKCG